MGSVTSAKAVPGAININEALPLVPEDITAAWCSKVLGKSVKSAVITKEYHGTASKLIVELTYEKDNAGPSSICVKGGFNPDLLAKMPMVKFVLRREAEFYYYVAPLVDLRLPKPYFCTTDTVNGQGIVVMEDLPDDTEFGSPMKVRTLFAPSLGDSSRTMREADAMSGSHGRLIQSAPTSSSWPSSTPAPGTQTSPSSPGLRVATTWAPTRTSP